MADKGDLCEMNSGDHCGMNSGDLSEGDGGKLTTARSRMPQLPPHFNEASNIAKTFFFLPASLLKVKKLQPPPVSL